MGGAVISNQNDVYAPMWNPAGLTEIDRDWQGAAMHAEYFESIAKYDYISFAKALDSNDGVLGISIVRLGVDNILNTTQMIDSEGNIDYDKISKFSTSDYAGIISYAFHPAGKEKLSVGVNAKIVYRNVGKFANGFGLVLIWELFIMQILVINLEQCFVMPLLLLIFGLSIKKNYQQL
jgi:hypothetical protein